MSSVQKCGCKGIRTCLNCEQTHSNGITSQFGDKKWKTYIYCDDCKLAWNQGTESMLHEEHERSTNGDCIKFPGVTIIKNFTTLEEEMAICTEIDQTEWMESQSGRRKQDYGPRVNFKKRKLKTSVFTGLPSFSEVLVQRMQATEDLQDFFPIELCNLEYIPDRGSAIDPHFDDFWIWGERLVTLTFLSGTRHRMTIDSDPDVEVFIPLPRRSLAVMQGSARNEWKHGILRKDITSRRIALTFRELAPEFVAGGVNAHVGKELLEIAATFEGMAVHRPTPAKPGVS